MAQTKLTSMVMVRIASSTEKLLTLHIKRRDGFDWVYVIIRYTFIIGSPFICVRMFIDGTKHNKPSDHQWQQIKKWSNYIEPSYYLRCRSQTDAEKFVHQNHFRTVYECCYTGTDSGTVIDSVLVNKANVYKTLVSKYRSSKHSSYML